MKNIKSYIVIGVFALFFTSCGNSKHNEEGHNHEETEGSEHEEHGEGYEEEVHLSMQQFASMEMKVDTLQLRNIGAYVQANGQLEVPPQNMAEVTAIIGANVVSINVIEGDIVKKGDVLAYLSHPDLIKIQTDYVTNCSELQYIEKEFERQKILYEEKVGSGKEFQKIQAEYQTLKAVLRGKEVQLRQLNLNPVNIQNSNIYEQVPVVSPINGHIRHVEVRIGQFVLPQTEMFDIVNIEHIHADLMVFESDMHKVKSGQKVTFNVQSLPGIELEAVIYSVGKSFEKNPKAVHLHAEIESAKGLLIPGMYIQGKIQITDSKNYALPEGGVVREGDKYYVFLAQKEIENGETTWSFKPMEVAVGDKDNGWVEIKLLEKLDNTSTLALNNAYYLLAEMKKGEAEHSH